MQQTELKDFSPNHLAWKDIYLNDPGCKYSTHQLRLLKENILATSVFANVHEYPQCTDPISAQKLTM